MANEPDQSTIGGVFKAIADKIRAKNGTTALIPAKQLYQKVGDIVTIKEGSSGCTATAADIIKGKTAITKNGTKVTGTKVLPAYTMEYGYKASDSAIAGTIDFTVYTTNVKRKNFKIYGFGLDAGRASLFVGDKRALAEAGKYTLKLYGVSSISNSYQPSLSKCPYAVRNSDSVDFYNVYVGNYSFSDMSVSSNYDESEFRFVIIDED